jgi:hypothetical protein
MFSDVELFNPQKVYSIVNKEQKPQFVGSVSSFRIIVF